VPLWRRGWRVVWGVEVRLACVEHGAQRAVIEVETPITWS
jgi:hypothetical protein